MALNHACFPVLLSGRSPAGERQRAGHIPGQSLLLVLVSCTMTGAHVGLVEDLCRRRKVVAEVVPGMMASSMGMVVVALESSQQELYRRVMVATRVVLIGLDRKGTVTVVLLGSVHMAAAVEAADS